LGLGIQPPAPSWGNILSDGQAQLFAGAWWICFFPGIGIFVSVLALNLVAEGFADSLASANRGMTPDVRVQVVAVSSQAKERDDLLASSERGDLLRVEHLSVSFPDVFGDTNVVSDVSFDLRRGEILSIVGESGCGKSLIGLALMGLLPPGASVTGRAFLNSEDLISMSSRQRRSLLGTKIAMVYQDGLASLNPGMTAGRQLAQACRRGGGARTPVELVEMVGLPRSVLRSYPGQLSGGQRQRVLIGLALAGSPEVLIADEPTTALDETIQAQIVDLLVGLQSKLELSVILVTHDLALAAGVADRVLVMYAGQSVEAGQIAMVVATPHHPYSAGLIAATSALEQGGGMLAPIPGAVPAPSQFPGGCRFQARCSRVEERCAVRVPALVSLTNDQFAACWNPITALSSVLEHALAPDVYE
jgi:peptide/nickel transport system permease protein